MNNRAGAFAARLEATQQALQQRREAEQGISADLKQIQAERERLNLGLVDTARQILPSWLVNHFCGVSRAAW